MVENEAWQTPFMKATRAVSRGPNRPAFSHRFRQRGAMELAAVRAPVGQPLVLRDDGRRGRDFHLLQHVGRTLERPKRAAAIGAAIERVGDHVVDGLGRKRGHAGVAHGPAARPACASCHPFAAAWAA